MPTKLLLVFAALAAAAEAQNALLAADLVKVFDAHNAAIKAKDADKALTMRSSAFRKSRHFEKKPSALEAQMYLAYVADITPVSYQVEYAAFDRDSKTKASLGIVAKLTDDGVVKSRIVSFAFEKEGGAWKMGQHEFWMVDVDGMKRPKSLAFEPKTAFTESWETSGRIVKVDVQGEYTLVIVRDNDSELAVFLPNKAGLAELQLKPEDLDVGNTIQFSGLVQKQDTLRMWATKATRL